MTIEKIDYNKCIKCQKCITLCPMDVLRAGEDRQPVIKYREECQSCYLCFFECPTRAILVKPDRQAPLFDVY